MEDAREAIFRMTMYYTRVLAILEARRAADGPDPQLQAGLQAVLQGSITNMELTRSLQTVEAEHATRQLSRELPFHPECRARTVHQLALNCAHRVVTQWLITRSLHATIFPGVDVPEAHAEDEWSRRVLPELHVAMGGWCSWSWEA